MMIDNVVLSCRSKDYRDHMIAEKLADLFWRAFAQSLSFVSNFLHPDGNLRWTQACD